MEEVKNNSASLTDGGDNALGKIFSTLGKQKSKVWTIFGFYKKEGKLNRSQAICKLCRASLTYTGSTTNLDQHARRKHVQEYGEFKTRTNKQEHTASSSTQPRTGNVISNIFGQLCHNSARSKEITASITHFITKGLCPWNTVEWEGFQDLIHTLEPRYKIPSRNHITNTCMPALYAQVKLKKNGHMQIEWQ